MKKTKTTAEIIGILSTIAQIVDILGLGYEVSKQIIIPNPREVSSQIQCTSFISNRQNLKQITNLTSKLKDT